MNNDRFVLRAHILIENDRACDDVILIDGHTGTVCASNASAGALILSLRAGATFEALVGALLARFDVTAARARRDVARFLDNLSALGLVEQQVDKQRRAIAA